MYGSDARCLGVPLSFLEDEARASGVLALSLVNAGLVLKRALSGKTGGGIDILREFYDQVPLVKLAVLRLPERVQQRLRAYAAGARSVAEGPSPSAAAAAGFLPSTW